MPESSDTAFAEIVLQAQIFQMVVVLCALAIAKRFLPVFIPVFALHMGIQ